MPKASNEESLLWQERVKDCQVNSRLSNNKLQL